MCKLSRYRLAARAAALLVVVVVPPSGAWRVVPDAKGWIIDDPGTMRVSSAHHPLYTHANVAFEDRPLIHRRTWSGWHCPLDLFLTEAFDTNRGEDGQEGKESFQRCRKSEAKCHPWHLGLGPQRALSQRRLNLSVLVHAPLLNLPTEVLLGHYYLNSAICDLALKSIQSVSEILLTFGPFSDPLF